MLQLFPSDLQSYKPHSVASSPCNRSVYIGNWFCFISNFISVQTAKNVTLSRAWWFHLPHPGMVGVSSGKAEDQVTTFYNGKTLKIKKPFKVSFKFKLSLEWPVDQNPYINNSVTHSGGDKRNQTGPRSLDMINAHNSTMGMPVLVEKVLPWLTEWPPSTRTADGKSHIYSKWPTTNCGPKTPKDFMTMIKKSRNEEKM